MIKIEHDEKSSFSRGHYTATINIANSLINIIKIHLTFKLLIIFIIYVMYCSIYIEYTIYIF